ncbi:javelin-like isoform X3 [Musca autumnalis]|uniref:javelin-like isoform X3 n=1 Tax=Musca autumnalis TaxID=221902 RepID=UPI003CFAC7C7
MATFADYDAHEEGGDDNSSVTICPDVDGDADESHSTHNEMQTNASTATLTTTNNDSETTPKLVCKSKSSPPHHNGSIAASQNHNSNNKESNIGGTVDVTSDAVDDVQVVAEEGNENGAEIGRCGSIRCDMNNVGLNASATNIDGFSVTAHPQQRQHRQPEALANTSTIITNSTIGTSSSSAKNLLLCRRFKDSGDTLRNFTSLPLFIYATSPSTHATSADGVGVAQVAVKAAEEAAAAANKKKNEPHELGKRGKNTNYNSNSTHNTIVKGIVAAGTVRSVMDCMPLSVGVGTHHPHLMASSNTVNVTVASPTAIVAAAYPHHHHMNLNHHHLLGNHPLPYSSGYGGLTNHHHHSSSGPTVASSSHHHHHQPHIHSEQTKSLQELQHEVGALLEFRDLVIETFPDLKHKMASISSAASNVSSTVCSGGGGSGSGGLSGNQSGSVSGSASTTTLTSGCTLVSRREWEPGIRVKRKISQKESNHPSATDLTSSSLTRSRSNSHSGKKEPKNSSGGVVGGSSSAGSGENNNGSVVQDSGFSTETSSSKEGHSASSTNGALTGTIASNRLSCPESDDELLNLLDVIHRKSTRLREEVEHLQNYERQHLRPNASAEDHTDDATTGTVEGATGGGLSKSSSSSANTALTPKTFREHVERLNKEDILQLRKERDRLLDKLAEMEAETLTGRIKATKMSEQVEELIKVKKDLEEQLKLAMAQRLELNSRVQQLQQQQQQQQSKSSNSQSDFSSSRTFLSSSATTVLSTVSAASSRQNTFQPVVVEQQHTNSSSNEPITFHQSHGSDNKQLTLSQQPFAVDQLGRLDGIVSSPGEIKCRSTDSKRFAAILLETSVIELQRHLLTLTVKNQILMQKLEAASKAKCHLVKRLDKSKDDVEDLRFQLEEKSIELEGTKAQLRVLESRLHSITPSSGAATNSYLHSQNDYETNRSSASTTLMLSRRGGSGLAIESPTADVRSSTPQHNGQMPQPITTQISTPSMKAMTHLPMDDMQHHSSSTESAHEHDLQHPQKQNDVMSASQTVANKMENGREMRQILMSTSVGGVSPFEQQLQQQHVAAIRNQVQALKKFSGVTATKPSKIPLPGSKAAAYFAGKPPSGRPSTAGRSPPSANSSGSSQSRSPLSRSTGNLLYSKSPNSLKRADSAQSIRKDVSSSFSTNTSRSSTSSSIPLATTPYGSASKSYGGGSTTTTGNNNTTLNSPSSRILQNSPLPKPKRESLSTKVRHMDSLSRAHNHSHQQQQQSHNYSNGSNISNDNTPTTTTVATSPVPTGSYLVSSTPKPSSIAAQLTTSLRKDLQLSNFPANQVPPPFQRRATGGGLNSSNNNTNGNPVATRRFSSASVMGARAARQAENDLHHSNISGNSVAGVTSNSTSSHGSGGGIGGGNGGTASDSDSGKRRISKILASK